MSGRCVTLMITNVAVPSEVFLVKKLAKVMPSLKIAMTFPGSFGILRRKQRFPDRGSRHGLCTYFSLSGRKVIQA